MSGCGKKGCTDRDASNYSASAKRDNETCRYEGSVVFWVSQSSAQQMLNDNIQSLVVYLDGDVVGTISNTGQTFTAAPACGEANAITVTQDLFSAKTKALTYRVLDDQSVKRWAGVVTLNGNQCEQFELVYYP